jgi:hypothetical protein
VNRTIGWVDEDSLKRRASRILSAYGAKDMRDEDVVTLCECGLDAYYSIISVLLDRGYAKAQVDLWAQRQMYQMDVAVYNYLLSIGFRRADKEEWIKELKRLDDLRSDEDKGGNLTLVDAGGAALVPALVAGSKFGILNLEKINEGLNIELPMILSALVAGGGAAWYVVRH